MLMQESEAPFTGYQKQQQNTTVTGPREVMVGEADGLGKPNHHPDVA